jgi:hypothetical protein
METAAVLSIFLLVFGAILFLQIRRAWLRYRVIAVLVPRVGDAQLFSYKITESIRNLRFREGEHSGRERLFRAPAWMKWAVGLQDISVAETSGEAVLVTGPGFWVSSVAGNFASVTRQPYQGRQPVWPLLKGILRLMGCGLVLLALCGLAAYLFAGR